MRYGLTRFAVPTAIPTTQYALWGNVSSTHERHSQWAAALKARMEELGYKQESLAAAAGTTQTSVQRWLSGSWPRALQIPGLAAALRWTADELLAAGGATPLARATDGAVRHGMETADEILVQGGGVRKGRPGPRRKRA